MFLREIVLENNHYYYYSNSFVLNIFKNAAEKLCAMTALIYVTSVETSVNSIYKLLKTAC